MRTPPHENAIGRGAAIGHLHVETAETVLTIGHSSSAHGVGDEDCAFRSLARHQSLVISDTE